MEADLAGHILLIKLAIAYTLLGAFIFTVVVVCLSLTKKNVIVSASQQKKLFATLIVELMVICVGSFGNLLELSPRSTQQAIQDPLRAEIHVAKDAAMKSRAKLNDAVLAGLKPKAAGLALLLLKNARAQNIELTLVSGYRSPDQQEELYVKGLTTARYSSHNTGLAFDVAVVKDGKINFNDDEYKQVGIIGKEIGLVWGGDWKGLADRPHFETDDARDALNRLSLRSKEQPSAVAEVKR